MSVAKNINRFSKLRGIQISGLSCANNSLYPLNLYRTLFPVGVFKLCLEKSRAKTYTGNLRLSRKL